MTTDSTHRTRANAPALLPPDQRGSQSKKGTSIDLEGQSRPQEIRPPAEAASRKDGAAPTLSPPGTAASGIGAAVTGTWTSGTTVDATWTINEPRNAFFHVAGGGWKKVYNGTDGAFTALLTLITQAKQTSHQIAFREEADGLVHEVYLW